MWFWEKNLCILKDMGQLMTLFTSVDIELQCKCKCIIKLIMMRDVEMLRVIKRPFEVRVSRIYYRD